MSPRKAKVMQTDKAARVPFAAWLGAVREGQWKTARPSDNAKISEEERYTTYFEQERFAEALTQEKFAGFIKVNPRTLRGMLSGEDGVTPEKAFEIGEDIALIEPHPKVFDRAWCSGIVAVATLPIYRIHVLRFIATLLHQNRKPTKDLLHLWPVLAELATNQVSFETPRPDLTWTESQRNLCKRAFAQRGSINKPLGDHAPAILVAACALESSFKPLGDWNRPLSVRLAEEAMNDALRFWFEGIYRNWSTVQSFG